MQRDHITSYAGETTSKPGYAAMNVPKIKVMSSGVENKSLSNDVKRVFMKLIQEWFILKGLK